MYDVRSLRMYSKLSTRMLLPGKRLIIWLNLKTLYIYKLKGLEMISGASKLVVHPGRVLRDLMKKQCVMMPGSFNGLVARMTSDMGF